MSYDIKFRKRTIEYLEPGHKYRETAEVLGISPNTLATWVKKQKERGTLEDPPKQHKPRKIDPQILQEYLEKHPAAYQSEIAEYFQCKQASVSNYLKKHGYTRKKR